jgi:hypothetical protein
VEGGDIKQFVDPEVTRLKFEREIQNFRVNEGHFREKGIVCLSVGENVIELLYGVPHVVPIPIAFSVQINYTNWDIEPPSVRFIDPFSRTFLQREEIKVGMFQVPDKNTVSVQNGQLLGVVDLLQPAGGINEFAFVCIPGVREYHQHPAHSGDLWMLHRTKGEGTLCVLIDQLYRHSIPFINAYHFQITQLKVSINGLSIDINKLKQ